MTARTNAHDLLVHLAVKRLNALPGVVAWKNLSTGDVKIVGWKPGMFKKVTPGAERGVADIIAILTIALKDNSILGLHCEFEAKTGTGHLDANQRKHRDLVREAGGIYAAFSEPDEPVKILRAWVEERIKQAKGGTA